MADYTAGDILRVTCKMHQGASEFQNVYHIKLTVATAPDDNTVFAAVGEFFDDAYSEITDWFPSGFYFDTIEVWNETQDEPGKEAAWPTLTVGTGTGDTLPFQNAALCLFNTTVARSQGRKFLPPMVNGAADNGGYLDSTAATDIAAFIASLLLNFDELTLAFVLGNYNKELARFAEWVSGAVTNLIRTQRRRVLGVGS